MPDKINSASFKEFKKRGMNIHDGAFWFCLFFLIGVALEVILGGNFYSALIIIFLASVYFLLLRKNFFALLILSAVLGAAYNSAYSYFQLKSVNIPFGEENNFSGIIRESKIIGAYQELKVSLIGEREGAVNVKTGLYPEFEYGDLIKFKGAINRLPEEYKNYFSSRGVFGQADFPKIELAAKNKGNFIKSGLTAFREKIKNIFKSNLPKEKAAFLAGITIGGKEDFSKDFKEKMSLSGTTHLIAMSGYNISIIALAAGSIFSSIFPGAAAFYLSILTVVLFVVMAGAEASVVRAAIMGVIALLSNQAERLFNPRNAIVIAAFVMVLINPGILIFDAGFQLSFAALLGLVYLAPVLKNVFKIRSRGLLSWKENAISTASAQIMALPILLHNFGVFSLYSLLANVFILGLIPMTMGIGFVMAAIGFFSVFLAKISGVLANIFISYEFFIIDIFSKSSLIISSGKSSLIFWAAYYAAIFAALFFYKRSNEKRV